MTLKTLMRETGAQEFARISIGALSDKTSCNIETIRYYEKIKLLPMTARTRGGHRTYLPEHIKRLSFILRGRQLGFSIGEIRALLGLVDGGGLNCAEVQSITEQHLGDVRQKITDLRKLERTLATTVSQCSGTEVPECPVIEALYA